MKRNELLAVGLILVAIVFATIYNLQFSFLQSRNTQRKGDIQTIANALEAFKNDHFAYPLSQDGRIVGCGQTPKAWEVCDWGNMFHDTYLKSLPRDPHFENGATYRYESDGRHFQLFAALEGDDDSEFNSKIFTRNLDCGSRICNFGRSDGATPLDKTIAEYENELEVLRKQKK